MGAINANGVFVYDENDIVSPIHTALNLQSSALSETLQSLREDLGELVKPAAYTMAKSADSTMPGGLVFGMTGGWSTAPGTNLNPIPQAAHVNASPIVGFRAVVAGLFRFSASIALESTAPNPAGYQQARILKFTGGASPVPGAELIIGQRVPPIGVTASSGQICTVEAVARLAVGEGMCVQVRHNYGGTTQVAIASRMTIEFMGL